MTMFTIIILGLFLVFCIGAFSYVAYQERKDEKLEALKEERMAKNQNNCVVQDLQTFDYLAEWKFLRSDIIGVDYHGKNRK